MSDLFGSIAIALAATSMAGDSRNESSRRNASSPAQASCRYAARWLSSRSRADDTGIRFFANDYSRFATAAPDEIETGNAITLESA
jgi:hypothetical protein